MATPIGTRKTKLKVGGTDFTDQVAGVRITAGDSDSDFVSFADALAGGLREYKLKLKILQDTAAASLWYYVWSQAGTEVAVEVWPNGGTTEGASTPKFVGTAVIVEPDGDLLGGDANRSTTAKNAIDVEWLFTAKPTLDITP
jgi:hypothetical protein